MFVVHILSISYVGSKPQPGHYNPDSVAERDFLRSEGDPAAIGYTINEAVSLTRSVVCSTSSSFDWHILFCSIGKSTHSIYVFKDYQLFMLNLRVCLCF